MHQPGPPETTPRSRSHAFLRGPFLFAITAAIVATLDPLGIEEATAARSEQTAMRLAAVLYPAYRPESDLVTVVTLDEAYAKRTRGTWPLSYRQQGYLLSLIDSFKPAAIFVDLIYKNPHEDASNPSLKGDDPANLLGALPPDTTTPIYLAGLAAPNPAGLSYCEPARHAADLDSLLDRQSVLAPIREDPLIAGKGRIALVEWDRCKDLYPLYLGGNAAAATPAYALYREWNCKGDAECLRQWPNEDFAHPMKVLWGAFPPRAQSAFYTFEACQYGFHPGAEGHSFWRRAGAVVNQLWLAALGQDYVGASKNDKLPCPALNVIPATVFAGVDPDSEEFREKLQPLLENRLVLVGADIRGAGDTILSPVHGQIAGVQLHAMALDNLVRFGRGYTHEAPDWVMRYLLPPFILTLIAWLTFRLPLARYRRALEIAGLGVLAVIAVSFALQGDWLKPALAIVGGLALHVIAPTAVIRATLSLLFIIAVAVCAIWLGYSPSNWLVLAVAAVIVSEKVNDEIHGPEEKKVVQHRIDRVLKKISKKG